MKKTTQETQCCDEKTICKSNSCCGCGSSGAIYGLGVVGALFYFLQSANTFITVMVGIGKSIVWPAILIFKLLAYLQIQ